MYELKPTKVYLSGTVKDTPDGMGRVERILGATGWEMSDVVEYGRDQAYDIAREIDAWPGDGVTDDAALQHQRPLVFTTQVIDGNREEDPLVADRPEDVPGNLVDAVLGYTSLTKDFHSPEIDAERNQVCWPTRDFGTMTGCPHGCMYCGSGLRGKCLALGMNVDEYMAKVVGPTIEQRPQQKCFRMIGWGAEQISLEPEYGVFRSYLQKLSEYEDRYGYFHAAGDNVDWVEDEPNRDRLIGVWSMTCEAVARLIEPGSPSAAARIEAGRKCQEWGVPARFKFKPVVPVRDWREEYAQTIELVFQRLRPESIGFCVVGWMNMDVLEQMIPPDLLDPDYVTAARYAAEEMRDVRAGPFPHRVRAEIYRHLIREIRRWDKTIPLYVSTESREMWEDIKDDLGQNPRTFMCGCNPIQAPGPRMMPCDALNRTTYFNSKVGTSDRLSASATSEDS